MGRDVGVKKKIIYASWPRHESLCDFGHLSLAVMAALETISSVNRDQELQRSAFKAIQEFSKADPKTAVVLNFKDLQLLRIKDLQQKLFDHHMRFKVGGVAPERYEDALKILDENLLAYGWLPDFAPRCVG